MNPTPAFDMERTPRPILSRDADSAYWMARYVERAENLARLLLVSVETFVDLKDLDTTLLDRQWQSICRVMHVDTPARGPAESLSHAIPHYMTFRDDVPGSLVASLTRARENARGIREGISSDMWEHLNALYWSIRADDAPARFTDTPAQFLHSLLTRCMTFHGLTDQTLPHDQRWHFTQLGRYFERITFTCRVMSETIESLAPLPPDAPLRNVRRITTLRACNSLEAYRRAYPGELSPTTVAGFLLLDPTFPRCVRHCVAAARHSAAAIRAEARPRTTDPAERLLGRLQAYLDYADPSDVLPLTDLPSTLSHVTHQIGQAALEVQNSYFLH